MSTSSQLASSQRRAIAAAAALVGVVVFAPRAARADAKEECLAAVDHGQSLRDDGKLTRARAEFTTCARDVCPGVVAKRCMQWLRDLDEKMPTIVLGAKDSSGADVAHVRITIDGTPLVDRLDGRPMPMDPGEHVLRFERDGYEAVEQRVVIRTGEKNRLVTATLRPMPTQPAPPVGPAPPDTAPGPEQPTPATSTARNVTAISLGVLGVVATGLGIYFGAQSRSQADQASTLRAGIPQNACTSGANASCQPLSDAVDAQNRDATLSTVGFIAGGVLVAGAIVTWLAWPKAKDERASATWIAPSVGPRGASVGVGVRF